MKLTEKELLEKYNTTTDNILDECDWKTHFTGEEVCHLVHHILKENNEEPSISAETLHEVYSLKVSSLKLTAEEWRENYGVPEIISMIYEILLSL